MHSSRAEVPHESQAPDTAFCRYDFTYSEGDYICSGKFSENDYTYSEGDYILPKRIYSSKTTIDEATIFDRLKYEAPSLMWDDIELATDVGSEFHDVGVSHVSREGFVTASPLETANPGQCHM